MKFLLAVPLFALACGSVAAQAGRDDVQEGNRLFEEGRFQPALEKYRQALEKAPDSPIVRYNLGTARYKNQLYDQAAESFADSLDSPNPELRARSNYNLGNTLFRQGKFKESIEAYQQALRVNPSDLDAKINLELALEKLKEQQEQQRREQEPDSKQSDPSQSGKEQDQPQAGESDPNQKRDPSGQPKPDQDDGAKGDLTDDSSRRDKGGERPGQDSDSDAGEEAGQPGDASTRPFKMTKEQAERLLQALEANRKGLIKRNVEAKDRVAAKKDW